MEELNFMIQGICRNQLRGWKICTLIGPGVSSITPFMINCFSLRAEMEGSFFTLLRRLGKLEFLFWKFKPIYLQYWSEKWFSVFSLTSGIDSVIIWSNKAHVWHFSIRNIGNRFQGYSLDIFPPLSQSAAPINVSTKTSQSQPWNNFSVSGSYFSGNTQGAAYKIGNLVAFKAGHLVAYKVTFFNSVLSPSDP